MAYSLCFLAVYIIVSNIPTNDASIIQVPTMPLPATSRTQFIPRLPGVDDLLPDGKNHPCYRDCKGRPKTCYYHFTVEWYQSMSKACYDCPFNITDCGRKDCVVADGNSRSITVINRKMPGPSIEVCQNDTIIVDVDNQLMASGTTIHWHGMHQKDTPFMDGTPYVTQCPIQPESTFRYKFKAAQTGTYFWHSHIGLQRGDGVAGTLIIRQNKTLDPHGGLYDCDNDTIMITDWANQLSISAFTDAYHSDGPITPSALLINGVGRFEVNDGNRTAWVKAPRFNVVKGKRYRFRLVNAEFFNCPVEMSVDGHNITVIASDGSELEPVTAQSLVSYAGERFDFIINADKKIGNYWIRFRGLLGCAALERVRQVGILHYEGANDDDPSGTLTWDTVPNTGLQINSVNQGEEQNITLTISKLKSIHGYDDSLKPIPDYKFYISYDLYMKDNPNFNKYPYYGNNQVKPEFTTFTPQFNHISMKLPPSPFLVSRPSDESFCNRTTVSNSCETDYCQCSHVLSVKLNSTVEIIIIDEGTLFDANHPFHLHGTSFRVVGQRRLDSRTTVDKVIAFEEAGLMTRNLINPPFKDTVTVPDGGYAIIRFRADNPGYWLFHCHIEFHAEIGMALVFKVGEHKQMKPIPEDFPSCGNFANSRLKSVPAIVKGINN